MNVLIIDDSENDTLLLVRELRKGGVTPNYLRVETEAQVEQALRNGEWHVIITDHNMPGFNSSDVINLVKSSDLDIPVIVVSGAIDDDIAVLAMKQGANDYMMKDNLARLVPAIEREIREAETRRARNRAELALNHLVFHDTLTNLLNRQQFFDSLNNFLDIAKKSESRLALLFIDLDRFKVINDTFGTVMGDTLLKEAADRLRQCSRPSQPIARYGGDEFLLVFDGLGEEAEAEAGLLADQIISVITQPFRINGHEMYIGASIGIAISSGNALTAEGLIQNADVAMLQAKSLGRNNYQFYTPEMNQKADARLELEQALHVAQQHNEFVLFYQPQIHIETGKIRGAEALLRWIHPEKGMIPPDRFIGILEDTGLIIPVGEWVMQTACTQWLRWTKEGLVPPESVVSVNISAFQFKGTDLVETVRRVLHNTKLPPHQLDLELTEGTLMDDTAQSQGVLQELKKLGVYLSIDDFGTGYSSLSYLKRFPIDYLKIDRSFVKDIGNNPDDEVIATAIIGLSHNLRMKVIAEGVENIETLSFLKNRLCDIYQGYYFSKPLPIHEFGVFIHASNA